MDVSATHAVNAYQRWEQHQRPSEALIESVKGAVKQQDHNLGDEGARMVAGQVAARYIDVRV
jgi:hypothetical protein